MYCAYRCLLFRLLLTAYRSPDDHGLFGHTSMIVITGAESFFFGHRNVIFLDAPLSS